VAIAVTLADLAAAAMEIELCAVPPGGLPAGLLRLRLCSMEGARPLVSFANDCPSLAAAGRDVDWLLGGHVVVSSSYTSGMV
jgi:hypothetical protein